ncbi:hypothetical protein OHB39_06280 [Streptomyces sp. NBC_00047]|uniref:hypothetical protein n=1 Tax=Streptomyces sp. NBC_00047 TaxID=2975627 RepID=UPI00225B8C16|nr:hypothetical protein [Streptomyces sp. NBC_00047]MCX5607190.1 hypothetical protein [Streptomyces sp. NBC_00047]
MKRPDSEALRTRRHRAHNRGDHSLCRPGVCPFVDGDSAPRFEMPAESAGESVMEAVLAFIDGIPPGQDGGPQIVMARCAVKLAAAIDGGAPGLPALVKQLAEVMGHIAESQEEDGLDDVRARHHARRVALREVAQG